LPQVMQGGHEVKRKAQWGDCANVPPEAVSTVVSERLQNSSHRNESNEEWGGGRHRQMSAQASRQAGKQASKQASRQAGRPPKPKSGSVSPNRR
jgi:hypothetical protein